VVELVEVLVEEGNVEQPVVPVDHVVLQIKSKNHTTIKTSQNVSEKRRKFIKHPHPVEAFFKQGLYPRCITHVHLYS
jgi:hypothetical protein